MVTAIIVTVILSIAASMHYKENISDTLWRLAITLTVLFVLELIFGGISYEHLIL